VTRKATVAVRPQLDGARPGVLGGRSTWTRTGGGRGGLGGVVGAPVPAVVVVAPASVTPIAVASARSLGTTS
jgi:hypothetical protein